MYLPEHPISGTEICALKKEQNKNIPEFENIASRLLSLVGDGNVRQMEALAIVIVRSDWGQIDAAASSKPQDPERPQRIAAVQHETAGRIARRAIANTISDATKGAVRFHRLGELPDWARTRSPVTQIGEYLFYR